MRLTARKAVEISRELWVDMAETGRRYKEDWSGWKKYGHMSCGCPLCEYDAQHRGKDKDGCPSCPLRNQWEGFALCVTEGSPYYDWVYAVTPKERKAAAHRMVALFDKWLEEHKRTKPNLTS